MEGRQAVLALLEAARRPVREVWIGDGQSQAPVLDRIIELASLARVPIRRVSRDRLDSQATTTSPQGVLARADPLAEADLDALLAPGSGRGGEAPFLMALDGVTDPQNLGALLRSAEAAGVSGIVVPRHRSAKVTPAVAKAAAGAVETVPIALVGGIPATLSRARDRGCWVVGLAAEADHTLFDLPIATEGVVVVLGAEGDGMSRLARQRCDLVVSIPMAGSVGSLNVAAAGVLALFEVRRRRLAEQPRSGRDHRGLPIDRTTTPG